jgi:thiamine biosynthesis lipoprotein
MTGSAIHDPTGPIAGRPVPVAPNAHAAPANVIPDGMRRWSYRVMGTTLDVVAPVAATEAGPLVKILFDDWDRRFSRFRADSELSRVNAAAGRTVRVDEVFVEVLRAAIAAAHATDGLFDPTVGARMIALGYDRTFVELPADSAAGRVLAPWSAGAWRSIEIDPLASTVRVPSGSSLDFGGIAKGMAVDAALDLLAAREIGQAAVDAGGDLAVRGTPPSLDAWPIALVEADDVPAVRIADGALATSSTTRRRWRVSGEDRHHLLDPRTGLPAASGLRSVTVLATSCRLAEVAAKTALLLGREGGERFLATHGLSGVLITDAGSALPVGRWRTDHGAPRDGASR